jgi:hypothetical protein
MKSAQSIQLLALMLVLAGCQSFYRGVVTLTSVVDGAAVEYARLYNDGLVTTELAQKVAAAHMNFRLACGVAKDALIAYKNGGPSASPEQYNVALTAAQQAAQQFIALLLPLLPPHDSIALQTRLKSANAP